MEENKQISSINDSIGVIVDTVKALEGKVAKNEQLLLLSFTHLYNKFEEENTALESERNLKDLIISEAKGLIESKAKEFDNKLNEIKEICKSLEYKILTIEIANNENKDKIASIQKKAQKKLSRKRKPWHYFVSKHWKYKKLLKEKEALEIEIEERNAERLRKIEEERQLKEKQKKEAEEKKRKEEEKVRQEKRKQSQKKIEEILRRMNKK